MKCPGQDSRYWKPGAIFEVPCAGCGQPLEFFKDEPSRRCKKCGHKMVNPRMDFGCAAYCKYAEQCIGELPPEVLARKSELLKDRVAVEMKRYFRRDFKRIGHAMRVARYAEAIAQETGGEPAVILAAAYLHDIGIPEAERKYQSSGAKFQEEEGPPIAREILSRLGARTELVEEVCDIIAHHHHPRPEETPNFRAVYDADLTANLEEREKDEMPGEELASHIESHFLSEAGKALARKVLFTAEDAENAEKKL